MTIRLHNSLTRRVEEFVPADPNHIKMYVCGPTVYDRPHLGNARSVMIYDVLYRLLKSQYPKVTYVRNITDVDDKINKAAKENGETISALTKRVTKYFHEDMAALNVLSPTEEPRATENIPQMISMIEKLIKNGKAYAAEGHVLFDVAKYPEYGQLSRRTLDDMIAGNRIEVAPYKKNSGDFVLWKPADDEDDESSKFQSPWGLGRPGWHIECSAMATGILSVDFDIHGGGADLMFPHHENEIAQSCCANPGSHYAKFWVHNGFLTVNGEKMSKSLGNFITVRDLLDKGVKGEVIRYALLSSHYRSPLDWTEKLLEDSKKAMDKLYRSQFLPFKTAESESSIEKDKNEVLSALGDDMNTSIVLGQLQAMTHTPKALKVVCNFLGLLEHNPDKWFKENLVFGGTNETLAEELKRQDTNKVFLHVGMHEELIKIKIDARTAAKKAKNFAEADKIRDELAKQGIILEDRQDGTTDWRRV